MVLNNWSMAAGPIGSAVPITNADLGGGNDRSIQPNRRKLLMKGFQVGEFIEDVSTCLGIT